MYRKELAEDLVDPGWWILGPDDEVICSVQNEEEADCLLSHLNR
jgi:hypothetical protein